MQRVLKLRSVCMFCNLSSIKTINPLALAVQTRESSYWKLNFERDMYKRRVAAGPEPERPRSVWSNWNYDSELFCFGKRLGEEFKEKTLRTAFIHKSYFEGQDAEVGKHLASGNQEMSRNQLDETDLVPAMDQLTQTENTQLIAEGDVIMTNFTKAWLRYHFPRLPEECICNIDSYLLKDDHLSYVAVHIGITDLILSMEFPPSDDTMAKTLKALVGALARDQGRGKAEKLVQDFVLTQLIGKDVNDLLEIQNPMGLLMTLLKKQGLNEPEPRLIHQSGASTLLSVYMVGIYVDKRLMGKSFGETPTIAEEMAARDILRTLFETTIHRAPLTYREQLQLPNECYSENYRVPEYFDKYQGQIDVEERNRMLESC